MQGSLQNLHQSDKILKRCEGELKSKPWKVLSTYSSCCLVLSVLTTLNLCVLLLFLPSFLSPSADLTYKKKTPLAFPSLHQSPLLLSFPLFLASSPHLINSSDNVSHRCSHYSARGASPLHLPVMDFQCFDHLTSHVVMSLPWVASLCKLFRNAWTLSVLLHSFRHYSLPRQSGSARPPLAWVKAMKTAAAVWQRLITRFTRPKRYMIHYVGMYKTKVGKNAGFHSTHRVLSGKLTVRAEFGFVAAPEWAKFLDSYGMPD